MNNTKEQDLTTQLELWCLLTESKVADTRAKLRKALAANNPDAATYFHGFADGLHSCVRELQKLLKKTTV